MAPGVETTDTVIACLNSLGCVFIILSYVIFPSLRVFSGHVSLFLAISGLGTALCLYVGVLQDEPLLCKYQAFGFIYFANVTIATTSYISYILYIVFVGKMRSSEKVKVSGKIAVSIWLLPLLLAGLPLMFNKYHEHTSVNMCWIHSDGHGETLTLLLQLACFYAPICVAMIYNMRTFLALLPHFHIEMVSVALPLISASD